MNVVALPRRAGKTEAQLLALRRWMMAHSRDRGIPRETIMIVLNGERVAWCGTTGAVSTVESQPCTTYPDIS
jgi:hypothetical protein